MPQRDLRAANGQLHPLSPFIVLATMCHPRPEHKKDRERMISTIKTQTGCGRARSGSLSDDELIQEVRFHSRRGSLAGQLLQTCIQNYRLGERPSLNAAISIIKSHPDRWSEKSWPTVEDDTHVTHTPHSPRKMMDAFKRFLPAAHLWAALDFGVQNDRPDVIPASNETLPEFLGYARSFAELGSTVPWQGRDRRFLLLD